MSIKLFFNVLFTILVGCLSVVISFAQPFSSQHDLSLNAAHPKEMYTADLDGDGDLDLIVGSENDNKVSWYENLGNENFSKQNIISISGYKTCTVYGGDLDGDGDIDIVAGSNGDDKVVWFENFGDKTFSKEKIITSNADGVKCVEVHDFDNDGNLDVISASQNDNKIVWFKNFGSGVFSSANLITDLAADVMDIDCKDIDLDGYIDVAFASGYVSGLFPPPPANAGQLSWVQNLAGTSFGPRQFINNNATNAQTIKILDYDNDGDNDILGSTFYGGGIKFYENIGSTTFSSGILLVGTQRPVDFECYDVDADGDKDLIVFAVDLVSGGGDVLYYKNNTTYVSMVSYIGSYATHNIYDVMTTDFEGDGNLEVLSSGAPGNIILARYNSIHFTRKTILKVDGYSDRRIGVADIDSNSHLDIVDYQRKTISMFAQSQQGEFNNNPTVLFEGQRIARQNDGLDIADMNNDGVEDVVMVNNYTHSVYWLEYINPDSVISHGIAGLPYLDFMIAAGDMDNDGDVDVISIETDFLSDIDLRLLRNNGDGTSWTSIAITNTYMYPNQYIRLKDFDYDGDLDIIMGRTHDQNSFHDIVVFENAGNGISYTEHTVTTTLIKPNDVQVADMDGDSLLDIVSASLVDDKLVWYKNLGGFSFSPEYIISDSVYDIYSLSVKDIDSDGDQDIVTASYHGGLEKEELLLFENTGNGTFEDELVLTNDVNYLREVLIEDIDKDGDQDIITTSFLDLKTAWIENYKHTYYSYSIIACDSFISPSLDSVYFNSGVYSDTLININGGDSVLTINLTIQGNSYVEVQESICSLDSFVLGMSVYDSTGIYSDTLTNICGYDSIVELQLTVNPLAFSNIDTTICEGDHVQIGDSLYFTTGNYAHTLETVFGCDSLITLSLIVNSISEFEIDTFSCDSFNVGETTYFTTGVYSDTLLNDLGCDSIVQLNLTIGEGYVYSIDSIICEGEGVNIGTSFYKYAGSYVDSLNSILGCDSIIVLNLEVIGDQSLIIDTNICFGESITVGLNTYFTTGNYTDSLLNQCELDSVVTLNLTVNAVDTTYIDTILCYGDHITIGSIDYIETNNETIVLYNQNHCDSIIFLNLEILEESIGQVEAFLCGNEVLIVGESTYSDTGVYANYFVDINGCDSIVTSEVSRTDLTLVSDGGQLTSNQPNAQYQWMICPDFEVMPGEINKNFQPEYNGSYAVEVTYNGCIDTSACFNLNNVSVVSNSIPHQYSISNPIDNFIEINLLNPDNILHISIYNIQGKQMFYKTTGFNTKMQIPSMHYPEGIYNVSIKSKIHVKTIKIIKI